MLVRRIGRRDEQYFIQLQLITHALGNNQVSNMRRIKRSAKNAEFHRTRCFNRYFFSKVLKTLNVRAGNSPSLISSASSSCRTRARLYPESMEYRCGVRKRTQSRSHNRSIRNCGLSTASSTEVSKSQL